jgi:hypothetical protein
MSTTPFSRRQEHPAWLTLRVNSENLHRASLDALDEMRELFERACNHFPERDVELVRYWGRPVAAAILVNGRVSTTRSLENHLELQSEFDRLRLSNPGMDVRLVEVFGDRGLRAEILQRKGPSFSDG